MIKTIAALATVIALCALAGCGGQSPASIQSHHNGSLGQSVADTAVRALGAPYTYGGVSPATGFDCSGLVWWSYAQNGVSLPRRTHDLLAVGRAVSPASAEPGDILVFNPGKGLHAGIALGESRFVHSPKSGDRVRVERWDAGYWAQRLITVRRP